VIDFAEVARSASLPDIAMRAGVALKPNGQEYEGLCPVHNERTPSFRIYQKTDGWRCYCFGCGFNGNALDFCQEVYGIDVKEAAKLIAGESVGSARTPVEPLAPPRDPYAGWKIGRPPAEAKILPMHPIKVRNLKRNKIVTYKPVAVYPYTDKHDDLIGYVLRLEIDGRKITPQVWWVTNGEWEGWACYPHPSPRPLYGLGELYHYPERQVVLTEGEKCADTAKRLFGDKMCSVSWMGGGKSISRTYWQSLAGRSVITWADNDDEGRLSMFAVHEALKAIGCKVKTVEIQPEDIPEGHDPKGWDIADAECMGKEWISDLIRKRIRVIE
jgi:putative DNA primase/helicase